jgi:hypothetical protein
MASLRNRFALFVILMTMAALFVAMQFPIQILDRNL